MGNTRKLMFPLDEIGPTKGQNGSKASLPRRPQMKGVDRKIDTELIQHVIESSIALFEDQKFYPLHKLHN